MKQQLKLTISKPCTEKFDKFKKTPSGGFCNSCKKDVINFRSMSDVQLVNYFKNNRNTTCGYFNISQLNKELPIQEYNRYFKILKVAAVAFLSLTSLHAAHAQDNKPKTEIFEVSTQTKISNIINRKVQKKLLTGTITDEFGPLPGANILLKDTSIGTIADFDGNFEFPKQLSEGDILVVSYLGYETLIIVIKDNQSSLDIVMKGGSCVLMGEVDVNEIYKSKRSVWQKIKSIF